MMFAQGCRQSVGKPQLPYVCNPSLKLFLNPEVWPPVAGIQHHKQYLTNCTSGRKQTHLRTNWLYPLSRLCWEKSHKPRFLAICDRYVGTPRPDSSKPWEFPAQGCGPHLEYLHALLIKAQLLKSSEDVCFVDIWKLPLLWLSERLAVLLGKPLCAKLCQPANCRQC